jgi:hypothetical protein
MFRWYVAQTHPNADPLHMAQKKSAKPQKATLDKILSTVERLVSRPLAPIL